MRSMRAYELMIIFDADVEDSGVQDALKRLGQQIEAGGGNIAKTDLWGRRRFAYEINHKFEGIYVVLELTTEAPNLEDVERSLRLADDVVRHKLMRLPDKEAARRGLMGEAPAPADAG
jgi:small subunit ribosomal protein S6